MVVKKVDKKAIIYFHSIWFMIKIKICIILKHLKIKSTLMVNKQAKYLVMNYFI